MTTRTTANTSQDTLFLTPIKGETEKRSVEYFSAETKKSKFRMQCRLPGHSLLLLAVGKCASFPLDGVATLQVGVHFVQHKELARDTNDTKKINRSGPRYCLA